MEGVPTKILGRATFIQGKISFRWTLELTGSILQTRYRTGMCGIKLFRASGQKGPNHDDDD